MILAPQIFNVMTIFSKTLCGEIGDFKFSATLDITRIAHTSNNKHTTPVFCVCVCVTNVHLTQTKIPALILLETLF